MDYACDINVISALGKLRQEHHEFKANLDYIVSYRLTWATGRLCLKHAHAHAHAHAHVPVVDGLMK